MKPINHLERTKSIGGFAALYTGTAALVAIIFFTLGNNALLSKTNRALLKEQGEKMETVNRRLQDEFRKIQQLDNRYATLLADSTKADQRDVVNNMIIQAERKLRATIDSIEQVAQENEEDKEYIHTEITAPYKLVLNGRSTFGNIRTALVSGAVKPDSVQQQLLELKTAILQKEEQLIVLEDELRAWQENSASANGLESFLKKENEALKQVIAGKDNENNSLKSINSNLDQDNKSTSAQLAALKTNDNSIEAIKERYSILERRYQQLTNDMEFAKIDCNLLRVDVNQIISNSKQRKELLNEALSLLTDLSHSNDNTVQKKANDKMAKLSEIASTIRD